MIVMREASFLEVAPLLEKAGLYPVNNADYRVGIFDADDEVIATGALVGDILQMIAVDPAYQGENLATKVVSHLVSHALGKGIQCLHLFTKSENQRSFESIGFKTVAAVDGGAALMEWGTPGIDEYLDKLKTNRFRDGGIIGAVVMNCNPFTLGHRHLVEYAASRCDRLYALIVEEDKSEFPFSVRLELVKRGVADIENVCVIPSGRYVISSLTFPAYFMREAELARSQAELDAEIFSKRIAPCLGISRRFMGEEPFSESTAIYNEVMRERAAPVCIEVVPRYEHDGMAVSASEVRRLLRAGDIESACAMLPESSSIFIRKNCEAVKQWLK